MATAGERTERATPWRRRKARQRGQVARSQDLTGALALVAGIVTLTVAAPWLWTVAQQMMQTTLQQGQIDFSVADVSALYRISLGWGLRLAGPVMLLSLIVALAINLAQVGFLFSLYPLRWDINKLSPIEGLQRLFSVQGLVQALKSVLKMAALLVVAWLALRKQTAQIMLVGTLALPESLQVGLDIAWDVAIKCAAALVVIGAADYGYQRYTHERKLMMTRPELREELRETEGDPLMQARRRQRRREMLEGGISREMPQASVVVTNPTQVAVALRYELQMEAPRVVAKGRGELAQRIVHYAHLYAIPLHQDRELARVLYRRVKLGQMIPARLYQAVAEVLAIILRRREAMRQRSRRRRQQIY